MHPKLAILFSALLVLSMLPAQGKPADISFPFTLQVASFPDAMLAAQYAERLSQAGEPVGVGTFELTGRGYWTRVYVGSFKTAGEARDYGNALIRRKLIAEYIIKAATELQSLGRPLTVKPTRQTGDASARQGKDEAAPRAFSTSGAQRQTDSRVIKAAATPTVNSPRPQLVYAVAPSHTTQARGNHAPKASARMSRQLAGLVFPLYETEVSLPIAEDIPLHIAPVTEVATIPHADPVYLAFNLISESRGGRGGLWVAGDREDAFARLRYIIGDKPELITLNDNGAVRINRRLLLDVAGANAAPAEEAPLRVAEYITANEGLLLIVQLTQSPHRYLLHIASRAPVLGGFVDVVGGINLDNNYDSRINPYRRNGRKLDIERPPKGFDALVAINPAARWLNLRANEFVSAGQITFHELAEAHAKVEMSLDYLDQGRHPGAHGVALEREERLQSQRPSANLVLTLGSNRLFRSEEEVRHFTAQTAQGAVRQR
ncbi:MAG: SPOR domain-containing protein [Blastocatellia bacterium]